MFKDEIIWYEAMELQINLHVHVWWNNANSVSPFQKRLTYHSNDRTENRKIVHFNPYTKKVLHLFCLYFEYDSVMSSISHRNYEETHYPPVACIQVTFLNDLKQFNWFHFQSNKFP